MMMIASVSATAPVSLDQVPIGEEGRPGRDGRPHEVRSPDAVEEPVAEVARDSIAPRREGADGLAQTLVALGPKVSLEVVGHLHQGLEGPLVRGQARTVGRDPDPPSLLTEMETAEERATSLSSSLMVMTDANRPPSSVP